MAIVLRADTGSALSHNQVDTNFTSFFYSSSLSGTTLTLFKTGSTALGISVASSSLTLPGGTVWTASAADISRFSAVTITGSFKQGSAGLVATGENAHAEGNATQAVGWHSHAEGRQTQARGSGSHAEGYLTVATGSYSHAEGVASQAIGTYSHAEGNANIATGVASHAEGLTTEAVGEGSHAEGVATITPGYGAHAEGFNSTASGSYSHAEGGNTIASGSYSHAEGDSTISLGDYSHTEGQATQALGNYSHAEGQGTVASGAYQHVQGQYNISSSAQSAFIIGNGTADNARRNLVFASGSQFQVSGSLNVSGAINTIGDLTVQGNITAQQYIVSTSVYFVTESFLSGSHVFGNSSDDTHQFTGSVIMSPDAFLPGSSSIYFGTKALISTSSFAIFTDSVGRLSIGNNVGATGYGADGIKIDTEGKVQLNHVIKNYGIYDTTLNIIGSGSNDGITMMQWPDTTNRYRITIQSGSQSKMNFRNILDPSSGSFDFSGSVAVTRNITAGVNIIAGSSVQGSTILPTSALILDGVGNNGMKASGSTANIFVLNAFTVGSGSYASPNVAEYVRINSGGLAINNGFDLTVHGNKQFNHGMFFHTASIAVANGSSGSVLLSTTAVANGVSITSGSRITIENPGYYNIQFSAQLSQGSGAANYYLWFKKNGSNIANSNSIKTLATSTNELMTVDIIDYASTAGDYYEIAHQSDNTNSTILYSAASGNIPATPAVIVTVQQVR